ncbi:hypothetical protein BGZ63DRAFT_427729 [Mariannaea sp. PMI_226]|nr:hypothetical protein BGZ63DRAFT_427729 [Mariannaea sp. PMI_226]
MPAILDPLSRMVAAPSWTLIARDGSDNSTTPVTGNTDTLAQDLFQNKFMSIARGGSNGEKIIRGFLIGVAIGLVVACFVCCWYPCCRPNRSRRRPGPRRPPVDEEEQRPSMTERPTEPTPQTRPSPEAVPLA